MKLFFLLTAISSLLLSNTNCGDKKETSGNRFRGRLEVQGICMNYTISVIDGNIDTSLVEKQWTDDVTKKIYQNAFRLGNPCEFPSTIKQGDEFYFTVDTIKPKPCVVCMAYYPTPNKSVNIKVAQ